MKRSRTGSAGQIRSSARQLGRLILNLLHLSNADEGKLVARKGVVDVKSLVTAVASEMEVAARERAVTFEVAIEGDGVIADEHLLHRTVANLLGVA
jgi:signal transduction histidine kinase